MPDNVSRWMKKSVIIVPRDEPVNRAANAMLAKNIGSLIVCDGDKPVGIVTETDIVRKVVATGVSSKLVSVGDIMSKKLITVDAGSEIREASRIMKKHGIKRLPVLSGERVVGMLSSTDLIHAMSEMK